MYVDMFCRVYLDVSCLCMCHMYLMCHAHVSVSCVPGHVMCVRYRGCTSVGVHLWVYICGYSCHAFGGVVCTWLSCIHGLLLTWTSCVMRTQCHLDVGACHMWECGCHNVYVECVICRLLFQMYIGVTCTVCHMCVICRLLFQMYIGVTCTLCVSYVRDC